jgi:hypothetical protein
MTPNALNIYSLQKYCQMLFLRFLAMTIFIPAENTGHSDFPGHIPGFNSGSVWLVCSMMVTA